MSPTGKKDDQVNSDATVETPLPAETRIATVALEVADLARSLGFYTDVIGLRRTGAADGVASLGVGGRTLVELHELASAGPAVVSATGLYHLAILVGSRVELGRSLARLVERGYPLGGASDHLGSEALYLSDPDGNGIEIYRDRPRAEWPLLDEKPRIDTLPLDVRALLDDARTASRPWAGLTDDAMLGHIHLQVDDLVTARSFYCDLIGFDMILDLSRMGALFVSAGGYHHHIGLNTWHSRGGAPRPPSAAGLVSFAIDVVDPSALTAIEKRMTAAGHHVDGGSGSISAEDPAGNTVVLSAGQFSAVERVTEPTL